MTHSLLSDVRLTIAAELGSRLLSVGELLEFVPGSVIVLDRVAGDPVDLLVNQIRFAHADVAVVDNSYVARIVTVGPSTDRTV